MKNMTALFVLLLGTSSYAAQLKCDYVFSGAPMGNVKITLDENGRPSEYADVTMFFTATRQMYVTEEVPAADEFLRVTLAKYDPNNEIIMAVKAPQGDVIKSILINAAMSGGMRELQGTCQLTSSAF